MRKILLAGLLFCALASAGDFTGIWVGQIPLRNGVTQDIAFQFTQHGTVLTGKLYGEPQSSPIIEGRISGELVTFVVVAQEQAGNQINRTRLRFTGSMENGEIELVRDRESSTNAGDGGRAQIRNNGKQIFRLKRLI